MNLQRIGNIVQILRRAGVNESEYFDAQHDILYIPWFEEEGEVATELENVGCHWTSEGSWATF